MMAPWDREKTTHKLCRSAALPSHPATRGGYFDRWLKNHIGKYISVCTRVQMTISFCLSFSDNNAVLHGEVG